ncbi:hypothetical protein D3C71_1325630 [compost metagenome]
MGDAYSDMKREERLHESAVLYCQWYYGVKPLPEGVTKERVKEWIYSSMGTRTPEELAEEINFKIPNSGEVS